VAWVLINRPFLLRRVGAQNSLSLYIRTEVLLIPRHLRSSSRMRICTHRHSLGYRRNTLRTVSLLAVASIRIHMQTVILPQRTPTRLMVQIAVMSIRNPYLLLSQQMIMLVLCGTHRRRTGLSTRLTFFLRYCLRSSVDILGDLFFPSLFCVSVLPILLVMCILSYSYLLQGCVVLLTRPFFLRGYDEPARSPGRTPCVLATLSVFFAPSTSFHFSVYNSMDSSAPFRSLSFSPVAAFFRPLLRKCALCLSPSVYVYGLPCCVQTQPLRI
jgi:hypothetical protein